MITIQPNTPKNPIRLIGEQAGICYGSDTSNEQANYERGLECLKTNHGRTFEFVDVFLIIEGYSARVIREWYTHIGGLPTRLQASTRYIDYANLDNEEPKVIIPRSIQKNPKALEYYKKLIDNHYKAIRDLMEMGMTKEDAANLLPLGMETKIVCKHNLRNLIDMSHQRMCSRAYWEYWNLMEELRNELSAYSEEWSIIVKNYFVPKCFITKTCPESRGCGRFPKSA